MTAVPDGKVIFPNPADASTEQLAYAAESWAKLVEMTKDEPEGSEGSFLACAIWSVWEVLNAEMRRRTEAKIAEDVAGIDDTIAKLLDARDDGVPDAE